MSKPQTRDGRSILVQLRVEQLFWLPRFIMYRFCSRRPDLHLFKRLGKDLFSAGLEGLFLAAIAYSPSSKQPFISYAWRRVFWSIYREFIFFVRTTSRTTPEEEAPQLASSGLSPEEVATRADLLKKAHDRLTPKQRAFVTLRWEGLSRIEIARAMGITLHGVEELQRRAYRRLKIKPTFYSAKVESPTSERQLTVKRSPKPREVELAWGFSMVNETEFYTKVREARALLDACRSPLGANSSQSSL